MSHRKLAMQKRMSFGSVNAWAQSAAGAARFFPFATMAQPLRHMSRSDCHACCCTFQSIELPCNLFAIIFSHSASSQHQSLLHLCLFQSPSRALVWILILKWTLAYLEASQWHTICCTVGGVFLFNLLVTLTWVEKCICCTHPCARYLWILIKAKHVQVFSATTHGYMVYDRCEINCFSMTVYKVFEQKGKHAQPWWNPKAHMSPWQVSRKAFNLARKLCCWFFMYCMSILFPSFSPSL